MVLEYRTRIWFIFDAKQSTLLLPGVFLPSANKVCEGYVFTPACQSVHRGSVCLSACWNTPSGADTPQSRHSLPPEQTPPLGAEPPYPNPPEQTPPPGADPRLEQTPPHQQTTTAVDGTHASYRQRYRFCMWHMTTLNPFFNGTKTVPLTVFV